MEFGRFHRFRCGDEHPYVALLISRHAYWLYAFAFDDPPGLDDAFRHPIFGRVGTTNQLVANRESTRAFLVEQQAIQRALVERLQGRSLWAAAVDASQLLPHVRLLQLMDALSLLVSFGGRSAHTFTDIPRGGWDDRITISCQPAAGRRMVCDPYPFDRDPLEVWLPVRILLVDSVDRDAPPLLRLHGTPLSTIQFEIVSQPESGRRTSA